jgi:hypothetical protein
MFSYTAFEEFKILAQGTIEAVAISVKQRMKVHKTANILIFSDLTGRQIDLDLTGTDKQVTDRLKMYSAQDPQPSARAGRPKLGVVAREVSLLPQHWEWLTNQDGGASAVIRNLIDEKIKSRATDKAKTAQERTYKFLSAIAGNLSNFEEATRFLYRKDKKRFTDLISDWPKDVVKHSMSLANGVF